MLVLYTYIEIINHFLKLKKKQSKNYCGRTALTAANFEATRAIMRNLKADGGRPLGVRPTLIMVGASNEAAAKALFEAQFLSGGGSNPNYNAVKVLVNPWMA